MEMRNGKFLQQEPYEPIPECIITDKVFFQCFQRECLPEVTVNLPDVGGPFTFVDVTFQPGFIVEGTLNITPIDDLDPTLNRISFTLRVPFTARVRNAEGQIISIDSFVDFFKDDAVRIPENPFDEFSFNIVVETRSEVLRATVRGNTLVLTIGTLIVIKVVGRVELIVLSLGYCVPDQCEEFIPRDICEEFLNLPFTQIFPEQLNNL
jgi:hypothetical protein